MPETNDRRERILDAARALIRQSHATKLSMRVLAGRARVSLTTPYNLFGSKAGVLFALLESSLDEVDREIEALRPDDPVVHVLAAAEILTRTFTADPDFHRPLLRGLVEAEQLVQRPRFVARSLAAWRRGVDRGVAAGVVVEGVSADLVSRQLFAGFSGALDLWVHEQLDDAAFRAQVLYGTTLVLLGVATDAARARLRKRLEDHEKTLGPGTVPGRQVRQERNERRRTELAAARAPRLRTRSQKEARMHVGMGVIFQGMGEGRTDRNVYKNELRLGDLAEPLGFESLWGVEHHFTEYTMCPDVLQYLTYFAGRTSTIQLGSMVVVLPWHQPIRVAEQVVMLDHMSNGRFIFGMGRGLGRVEFEGFGLNQEDSRETFVEAAQMILQGLERGYCEFDGKFVKQVRRDLRPRPFKSFRGRTYAAAVSPESFEIMAKLGVGVLIIPQKPWDLCAQDLNAYRQVYKEVNGVDAPPTIVGGWTYCDENADRAEEYARKFIGGYWKSVVRHYELVGDHLTKMKGYESYKTMQEKASAAGGVEEMTQFFLSLQVWGTPEQCYEKIVNIQKRTGAEAYTGIFSYAGMPYDLAESNMRLFASEVMPELKKHVPLEDQLIARAGIGAYANAAQFRLPA